MWYRVFGLGEIMPQPAELQQALRDDGFDVPLEVRGDDLGWTALGFRLDSDSSPIHVERYLSPDDDIRSDLDAWAGWLETQDHAPNHQMLMERVVSTRQLFTIRRPLDHSNEIRLEQVAQLVVQFLARATDGLVQIDGKGFFDADGLELLIEY